MFAIYYFHINPSFFFGSLIFSSAVVKFQTLRSILPMCGFVSGVSRALHAAELGWRLHRDEATVVERQGWSSKDGIPGMDGEDKAAGTQRQGWRGRKEGPGMKLQRWSSSSGAGVGMAGVELQGCSCLASFPALLPIPAVGSGSAQL